jgi:hypothetical protein
MTEPRSPRREPRFTRRRLLAAGGGVALTASACVAALTTGGGGRGAPVPPVRPAPAGRSALQHLWDDVLAADGFGNRTAPRHNLLLHLRLEGSPTVAAAAALEDGLRALEHTWPAGPAGLLVLVGWGPAWFGSIGLPSPVPAPAALTPDEAPELDRHVACIHLASDREDHLERAERHLRGVVRPPLAVVDRRAGFTGRGLPRRLGRGANGIPPGEPSADSPLFMGFASGFRRNQAREDTITIADGPWAGATTMHVSVLSLALSSWFSSLDERQRAARMFAPQLSLEQVRSPGAGLDPPGDVVGTARRHGVIGHAQAAAQARRDNRPIILRRDFNGRDGDQPLVHFVALQRTIADFEATRRAMAASRAVAADARVQPHVNNGINEWLTTRSRANYLVPPRDSRTCPGLDGWDA